MTGHEYHPLVSLLETLEYHRTWPTATTEARQLIADVARLTAERDALAERVCPYVVTSDEGTSYCSLNLPAVAAERDDLSGAIERALHKAKTNEWHAMVAILTEAHTADPTRQPTA